MRRKSASHAARDAVEDQSRHETAKVVLAYLTEAEDSHCKLSKELACYAGITLIEHESGPVSMGASRAMRVCDRSEVLSL